LIRTGAALAGTFAGTINTGDGVLTFFAAGDQAAAASATGAVNADGGATGSLAGSFMRTSIIIAPQGTCSDPGITWSLIPRD
jgi:hypothetical protein